MGGSSRRAGQEDQTNRNYREGTERSAEVRAPRTPEEGETQGFSTPPGDGREREANSFFNCQSNE